MLGQVRQGFRMFLFSWNMCATKEPQGWYITWINFNIVWFHKITIHFPQGGIKLIVIFKGGVRESQNTNFLREVWLQTRISRTYEGRGVWHLKKGTGIIKHFMTGRSGNSEFCHTSRLKNRKNLWKNDLLDAIAYAGCVHKIELLPKATSPIAKSW